MNKQEFINRYNQLAAKFLISFSTETAGENIAFSPFSILSMLSILADASAGKTRQEIKRAMYGDSVQEGLPEQLQKTKKELTKLDFDNIIAHDTPFGTKPIIPDYSHHLNTANAVFIREDFQETIHPQFQNQFRDRYNGAVYSAKDIETAMEIWLAAAEGKKMPLLELPKAFSESILALVNTVFFEAMWIWPYEDNQVKKRIFTNGDNTKTQVNMMYCEENTYVENEQATGFIKQFQQCDYDFMALLPKQKGQKALQKTIETSDFQSLMNSCTYTSVRTAMPEFTIESERNLRQACADLGITDALTSNADFSPMTTARLPAKEILHKAKIEVNRHGVKAAAATLITLCLGLPPEEKKEVILNRPFIFAIMHRSLNIPVFIGVVNKVGKV